MRGERLGSAVHCCSFSGSHAGRSADRKAQHVPNGVHGYCAVDERTAGQFGPRRLQLNVLIKDEKGAVKRKVNFSVGLIVGKIM
jgi:hypothetical protein